VTTVLHLLGGNVYAVAAMAVAVALLALVATRTFKKAPLKNTPAAVIWAAIAAIACTAYSGDTSWRFAGDHLGMRSIAERAAMFAAAEVSLFATGLMARQNLRMKSVPGTPGMLMWLITGVQVIPAFAESGIVGGFVRAFVGPVLGGTMWHLAMGIELWHAEPGALSNSLPAVIGRELRERLLSRLGLAVRDRSAEQITRDRWTVRAVALAAQLANRPAAKRNNLWGRRIAHRLSVAVGRAQAGASPEQRRLLLDLLAARRHATQLATVALPSPWESAPEAHGQDAAERHGGDSGSATATATEAPQSAPESAPGSATAATPGAPQARHESEPQSAAEAPRKRDRKAAQKRSAQSPRDAARDAIRSLYEPLGRRPVESEMVAVLKSIKSPFDSPAFAKKIRAEIEAKDPSLAALGNDNVRALTGTDA
jgi:hypothetical protein